MLRIQFAEFYSANGGNCEVYSHIVRVSYSRSAIRLRDRAAIFAPGPRCQMERAAAMRTIGLIGGMSWESTAVYYRRLNEQVRIRLGGLHSADILMRSVDFDAIVSLQKQGRWDETCQILADIARALEDGGAGCIARRVEILPPV